MVFYYHGGDWEFIHGINFSSITNKKNYSKDSSVHMPYACERFSSFLISYYVSVKG